MYPCQETRIQNNREDRGCFIILGLVWLVGSGPLWPWLHTGEPFSIHWGGGGGLRVRLGSGVGGWGPMVVPWGRVGPAGSCIPRWPVVRGPSACHSPGALVWVAACRLLLCGGDSGAPLGAWAAVSGTRLGPGPPGGAGRGRDPTAACPHFAPPGLAAADIWLNIESVAPPSGGGGPGPGGLAPGGLGASGLPRGGGVGWAFGVGVAWGRVDGWWWGGVCCLRWGGRPGCPGAFPWCLCGDGSVPPWVLGLCLGPVALAAMGWGWAPGAPVALWGPLAAVSRGMGSYLGIR